MKVTVIQRNISIYISCFFFLVVFPVVAGAQVLLEYRHYEGDQWHLTSQMDEEVLIDGEILRRAEILNKISVDVRTGEGAGGLLWNSYSIAESIPGSDVYLWSGEFEAEYNRDSRGYISGLPQESVVPAVRGVPVYPEYPVISGDIWTAPGTEILDLEHAFGIPLVVQAGFEARYSYEGPETADGKELNLVIIDYEFQWVPDWQDLEVMQDYLFYPVEMTGQFHQEVLFDAEAGRNYAEEGSFSYTWYMSDGHVSVYRGSSHGQAVYVETMNRDALIEEIEDLGQEDLRAEVVAEGIKVSLENINFIPDEAVMLPGQEEKLAGILEILARYPNRDIRVIGHTARVSSGKDGQFLSETRAEAVAQHIIDSGVRTRDRITIRGMGNRDPVGDNATETGRRMNRRVEIIILEN